MILGHRGASADAPENTIDAYRLAIDQGADGVELDVRVSTDGVLVLNHNPTLGDGRHIHEVVRAELPPSMPTLAAALDALAGSLINIELKNLPYEAGFDADATVADMVADQLAVREWSDDVIVSSFHIPTIERFKAIAPAIPTGVLSWFTLNALDSIDVATDGGHQAIHPHAGFVTPEVIEKAHDKGLEVNTWTVDEPDHAFDLARLGIDGLVTNVPGVLLRAFARDDESERVGPVFESE